MTFAVFLLAVALGQAPSPNLKPTVTWIGNSFAGAQQWVQQDIAGMAVTPDGTVYTNVGWDEAGREVGMYARGEVIGIARHTHGWGYSGGRAVAVNARYVYFLQGVDNEGGGLKDPDTWPAKGLVWHGVARRLRSDLTQPAPFAGAKGGKGDTLRGGFLLVNETTTGGELTGLAASDTRIYVSNPTKNQVEVFDAETLAPAATWPLERPGPLALDSRGRLWAVQTGGPAGPANLVAFGATGAVLTRCALPAECEPTALAATAGERLLLADGGPAQQIRIFDVHGEQAQPHSLFGAVGGIGAPPAGRFGSARFNQPSAVGSDAAGNVYVAHGGSSGGGSTVLESYSPEGALLWRLFGLTFVDMADVDPANDADVFTKEERFRLDWTQPAGHEWSYAGYTLDRFRYPDDPRLQIWSAGAWVRRLAGRRFLFVNDMYADALQVYRFEAAGGEAAVPSGLFRGRHYQPARDARRQDWPPHQPARGEWIWRDTNGNGAFDADEYQSREGQDAPTYQGWWVDAKGSVWQASETQGLRCWPLQGLDAAGNPVWTYATMKSWPHPAELKTVKRLRYDPAADTMLLGGTTAEHSNQHWKPMGPVVVRYDGWSTAAPKVTWTLVAPYAKGSAGHESCEPMGFDVAGDYLFVPYTGESKALGYTTGHVEVFRLADAAPVGHFEPSAAVGQVGLQDIRETLTAHRRADGEYVVMLEDDWKSKVLVYRWKPTP